MMKIATKLLLLLLTVLMCASCFVACGGDDVTTTTPADLEVDKVPGLKNTAYSGKTCNIWHKKNSGFGPGVSMYTEDAGVSAVARASTSRLETFQASTGVKLNFHESTAEGTSDSSGTNDIAELRSLLGAASAGNVYDIVMPGGYAAMVLASEGLFTNLATNPQMNLDHPAWQKNINDGLSVCGGYFAVSGLFSVANIGQTACLYVDKTALANLTAPELLANTDAKDFVDDQTLYQWAKDGTWTYDKMLALAAAFTGENGKIAEPGTESEGDEYGLEFQGTSSYTVFMSTGKQYVGPNPAMQNIPTLKVGEPETVQVLNWLIDNVIAKPYVHSAGGSSGTTGLSYFGLSHQCLFRVNMVAHMSGYAQTGGEDGEEGFDFGILPMPKMDYTNFDLTEQDSYHGAHNAWFSTLAAIPKLANDTEFSGFVLETFTEMGYTKWNDDPTISTIWEAYIEDGLDGRYAPDQNDVDMLYLCLESATSDLGEFMVWKTSGIGNIANAVRDRVLKSNKEWEVYASGIQAKVDAEVIEMLYEMGLIAS